MDCSKLGFPVLHHLLEFAPTHHHWVGDAISSSIIPFSSHLKSFPASGSFSMSEFFTSNGQSIGASASVSVLPMTIQDWFPLGWTGWISLQSKGLLSVFSNTTVQIHQFFVTETMAFVLWNLGDGWTMPDSCIKARNSLAYLNIEHECVATVRAS